MEESIEYQYIQTQLAANRYVRNVMETDITNLLNMAHQKRQIISDINQQDIELHNRINAMSNSNKYLVNYSPYEN